MSPMRRFATRVISLTLLLLAATLLAGCFHADDGDAENKTDDAEAATPTPVTAESVLREASARWTETTSAHFALAVEGEAFLDTEESIKLLSAEGDILRPNSVTATAKIEAAPLVLDISMIAVGGDMYMTNFISGKWESAPEDFSYDPSVLFSETEGIGPILTKLQAAELDGTEQVNGREARVVKGTVDAETVEGITAGAIQGESIDVSLWIDSETSDMLKVTLTEPQGIRDTPATWTLLLSDHNKELTIEPPL